MLQGVAQIPSWSRTPIVLKGLTKEISLVAAMSLPLKSVLYSTESTLPRPRTFKYPIPLWHQEHRSRAMPMIGKECSLNIQLVIKNLQQQEIFRWQIFLCIGSLGTVGATADCWTITPARCNLLTDCLLCCMIWYHRNTYYRVISHKVIFIFSRVYV